MIIQHKEYDIHSVLRYFVTGFRLDPGMKLENWEANYDQNTGKVIFTLFIDGKDCDASKKPKKKKP